MLNLPNTLMPSPADDAGSGPRTSYRAAIGGDAARPWMPSSADPRIRFGQPSELYRMRDRSRELQRNNAVAAGMFRTMTELVIGQGFALQFNSADPEWNKRAQALMNGWFPTADCSGLTWLEHITLAYMASVRDGDVATLLIQDGTLQLLEGDLIASRTAKQPSTYEGVTIGPRGRPTAFTFRTVGLDGKPSFQTVDSIDVLFLKCTNRAGQIRGEPLLASTLDIFDLLDRWIEAELMATLVGACSSTFIQLEDPQAAFRAMQAQSFTAEQRIAMEQAMNGSSGSCPPPAPPQGGMGRGLGRPGERPMFKMTPGGLTFLKPGEKVVSVAPTHPNTNFPDVMRMFLRLLGVPLGMPLELTLQDFSTANNNAARAALLLAYRNFATKQQTFIDRYLTRIARWRISKFVKDGLIDYRDDMFSHRWIAPHWPMLDPVKELQARQMAIDVGETTLTEQLRRMGKNIDEYITERAAEIQKMQDAGMPLVHSQAFQPFGPSGAANPPPPPVDLGEDDDENNPNGGADNEGNDDAD